MSTLDFIPHSLKRKKAAVNQPSSALQVPILTEPISSKPPITLDTTERTTQIAPPESKDKPQKKKEKQDTKPSWEFAFLVWLALSDYSLWADGDLRRRMDTSENAMTVAEARENSIVNMVDEDNMVLGEKESRDTPSEQGYVPLDHLLKHSDVLRLVSNLQPYCNAKEITYVNALRQFAKDEIDVRFIVNSESSSTRAALTSRRIRKPQSGYEVRRTDFASLKESEFSRYSKSRWDTLTVYMENIPKSYAKVPGIGKLIASLLPASTNSPMKRVQNIVFPPHHQDLPGSIPSCKGFALMTLSSEDDVPALLDAWPWESDKRADSPTGLKRDDMTLDKKANKQSAEERSAKASGLRICTKARWEELRAEYLLYRQQLVDEINRNQDEEGALRQEVSMEGAEIEAVAAAATSGSKRKQPESTAQNEAGPGIHPDSPYPTECLVFVRHVHPETNKTTLRTLFSRAWATESDNAIDYIDYSKNTNSCYVRFGTPAHAELFVDYFSSHHIAQLSGLDKGGSESSSDSEVQFIKAEIVLGKREEVYWDKIPEKLRRQAVEKTLRAMHGGSSGVGEETPLEGDGGGRKKRRRKGKASE